MSLPEEPPKWFVGLCFVVIIGALGLVGWGAIELIQLIGRLAR